MITKGSDVYGSQCIVLAIDARRNYSPKPGVFKVESCEGPYWFEVYTYGGRRATGLCAVEWSRKGVELGAGEILVTSMDRDGTRSGFDIELTRSITEAVNVPVIASGGAGEPRHFLDALTLGKADAVLAASVFHYNNFPVPVVKNYLKKNGIEVRI